MDKADDSSKILFDVRACNWSSEMRAALGIPAASLPPTFEGTEVTGRLSGGGCTFQCVEPLAEASLTAIIFAGQVSLSLFAVVAQA
jgi:sugar (pentulose or hexulose) kinase